MVNGKNDIIIMIVIIGVLSIVLTRKLDIVNVNKNTPTRANGSLRIVSYHSICGNITLAGNAQCGMESTTYILIVYYSLSNAHTHIIFMCELSSLSSVSRRRPFRTDWIK